LQSLLKSLTEQIRETIGYAVVNAPLHASAMDKLVLAAPSDDDIRKPYPDTLPRFASYTLTRRSALLRALAEIRQQGWPCVDGRQPLRAGRAHPRHHQQHDRRPGDLRPRATHQAASANHVIDLSTATISGILNQEG